MELENNASSTVFHFISEMNEWERFCNLVAQDKSLSYDEQYTLQKERLLHIFNLYCKKSKRKSGRSNTISYGFEGTYEYDPHEEVIVTVEGSKPREGKFLVYTLRERPLNERFLYTVSLSEGHWLIESKKRYVESKDIWSPVSL